jgi:23S rRNA A2030 N6-methylase RlmJ
MEHHISLAYQKPDPKPGAPTHVLRTIDDVFQLLNPENIDRFFTDFRAGVESAVQLREAAQPIIDALPEAEREAAHMTMPSFEWTDDYKTDTQ